MPKKKIKFEEVYKIIKDLGRGGSGAVKLVTRKRDGQDVAVKILDKDERFKREISVGELEHENILAYDVANHLIYKGEEKVILEGEYFKSVPLLGNKSNIILDMDINEKIIIMQQVVQAVKHLHHHNYIHRDIKLENILINNDEKSVVKLIDYGVTKKIQEPSSTVTGSNDFIGTKRTSSPDALKGSKKITQQDDIYSLGVSFIELAYGRKWNEGMVPSEEKDFQYIKEFKEFINKSGIYEKIPLWLAELMSEMTYKKKQKRIVDLDIILESLENNRFSDWWLNKIENVYKKVSGDYSEWENRKIISECTGCKLIYTIQQNELAKIVNRMNVDWGDLIVGHMIDIRCNKCRKADDSIDIYQNVPYTEYDYIPGKIIEIFPEPKKYMIRHNNNITQIIRYK